MTEGNPSLSWTGDSLMVDQGPICYGGFYNRYMIWLPVTAVYRSRKTTWVIADSDLNHVYPQTVQEKNEHRK